MNEEYLKEVGEFRKYWMNYVRLLVEKDPPSTIVTGKVGDSTVSLQWNPLLVPKLLIIKEQRAKSYGQMCPTELLELRPLLKEFQLKSGCVL